MGLRKESLLKKRFGKLIVLSEIDKGKSSEKYYLCLCDCGKETIVLAHNLISGHTRSCGCLKKEIIEAGANTKHGLCYTRIYKIWKDMRRRCNNPNRPNYPRYGGRGIKVCSEWDKNFMSFYIWAMENGYNDDLSIDRIDNNQGYRPENCRWVTNTKQANNRRNNRFIEFEGERHTISEWASLTGLGQGVIESRLNLGWDSKKILKTPVRIRKKAAKLENGSKVIY